MVDFSSVVITFPLMPRGQFLFVGKKEPKTMSAESDSLKNGYTSLKIRNLPYVMVAF